MTAKPPSGVYFETLRSMTDDPDLLAAIDRAESQIVLDRAREQVRQIEETLARSRRVSREYRRWLRRPRCWWCGH